ncbi:hypothetical protein [Priestia megaterium]
MKPIKLDVALIIVFLTGIAYVLAYVYEFSYQAYYGLPRVFIDLNITTITSSLMMIGAILSFLFGIINFVLALFTVKSTSIFNNMSILILMALTALLICLATFLGSFFASHKEQYMVVKEKKELFVVVTTYKDNLVIAPLDIKKETIKPKFKAIEMKDADETEVINFKNGIKVDKLKSSNEFKKEIAQKPLNKK